MAYLRRQSQSLLAELVRVLPEARKQRVAPIPLLFDDKPGEVNAYAGCTRTGAAVLVLTDGILDIMAHMAQAKATDDVFGTKKLDGYIRLVATEQREGAPVVRPRAGFFDPQQHTDSRKVKRQHELYDEMVAFVLGHELAHHYLGHLPCTATASQLPATEVSWVLSSAVPGFNQPAEYAADTGGTYNVLDAGAARGNAYRLTEGGGIMMMQFFSALDSLTPATVIFGFERSHPPPQVRLPVMQSAASGWRSGIRVPL
jgi:hypothetical protein